MRLEDTREVTHQFLGKLNLLGTLEDRKNIVDKGHVLQHAGVLVKFCDLALYRRKTCISLSKLWFQQTIVFLLLLLVSNNNDLSAELVVDSQHIF